MFALAETEGTYFGIVGGVTVVLGLVMLALSPWIQRAVRGVR